MLPQEDFPSSLFQPLSQQKKEPHTFGPIAAPFFAQVWLQLKHNRLAIFGLCMLAVFLTVAILGPIFSSYTYYGIELSQKNMAPSTKFWFGTDELGRDLFVRVCYGGRISFFVGLMAALVDLIIGVLWGSLAACSNRNIDEILMRIADILYAVPYMLVVIMLTLFLGSGLLPIIAALALTNWINMARIVRSNILQIKQQEYVAASIALGAGFWHILLKHLLPNAVGSIIVTMTLSIPAAIFTEAFLSFLGLGVQAPIASWGTLASEGLPAMRYYPWRLIFPASSITLTLWAFNLLGEGLQQVLTPHLKNKE